MKKLIILSTIIILASTSHTMAQMIVKIKPQRPNVVMVKPTKIHKNKIWIEGHWKWAKQAKNYQWVKGRWVKSRINKTWRNGKWKKIPAGWKYVPGQWSKS
jgi:hypothetical protein